ncbi:glycosyltransferase [Mitsuaria sp. GD03876]|uniref:glycosyltransferase n=1 Tax=Mitsuaria sp. GD03876 TaxID=2975399 RepID=UPI0024488AAF|nr:glycosyltransferase [Mitsuaria sp. GD03876]MDH0864706.1 glycosyltransferase [Mitsuaria sp. GD03876]
MHVVEVLGALPPDEDGATRLVERLIERLGAGGDFRFTVLCPADGPFTERLRGLGVETIAVAMPEDPPWHAIQVLVGLVRNRQADVLHAHLPNAHRLAGLAGSITRTPVLATVQGLQLDMPDLEVHRLIASQLSVVTEASYFHALGLGIAPERISCEPFDADGDASAQAASLDALGQRLRALAPPRPPTLQPLTPASVTPASVPTSATPSTTPTTTASTTPSTSSSATRSTSASSTSPPVAIRAVLDELVPSVAPSAPRRR